MDTSPRRRRFIFGGIALLVLGVVGFVYAAWVADGTGSGYAKAQNGNAVTTNVIPSADVTATLYPGADGNLKLQVANSNPYPVKVTDVDQTPSSTITSNVPACDAGGTGVTVNATTLENAVTPGSPILVPANDFTTTTLSNVVHMSNSSDTNCQGARFEVPVDLAAESNAS
jgi:hypothetical protein